MRTVIWLLRGVLFLFLFGFAVKNDQVVTLHFFFGSQWSLPLVFIILVFFAGGILLGVTSTSVSWFRQRRELSRLRRQVLQLEQAAREGQTAPPRAAADLPVAF